jgi:hypothetical protein
MPKKKKYEEDEDLDNFEELENDNYVDEELTEESIEDGEISESFGDDVDVDFVIEISEESEDSPIDEEVSEKTKEDGDEVILSKHKVQGKHSLKYDSIFKGKKDEKLDEDVAEHTGMYFNEKFEVDKSSFFYVESHDNEFYIRQKNVKERVYNVLLEHTNINFLNNRRKPSKSDFNNYYHLLRINLEEDGFTNIELFNELSVYFSDNLFNMFKLLDNKWRNLIIIELQDHIGKNTNSKEITNRNIYVGTELEFTHFDTLGKVRVFSGVVTETDYQNSLFKVDSYEKIYEVDLKSITKILNNTKFKYNLNKLNNIDFL